MVSFVGLRLGVRLSAFGVLLCSVVVTLQMLLFLTFVWVTIYLLWSDSVFVVSVAFPIVCLISGVTCGD